MANFAAILPAAGKSSRFHDKHYKKPFAILDQRAVWLHSAEKFLNRDDVKQVLVVVAPEDREDFMFKFGANVAILGVEVVDGGAQRADSIANALERVKPDIDFVAVHDAARPCMVDEWISTIFSAAEKSGAAIFAVPVAGTLKRAGSDQTISETVDRSDVWEAQTPQVFKRELLVQAYAQRGNLSATDDAQLVEQLGHPVTIVPGSSINFKITTREDLRLAQHALKALPKPKLKNSGHPFADDDLWR
ncbi:MAG: 2-C-methyl-D-erythritol 4-phosphate cytidylyltransferase [Pirellulaceae bacterium]|nr:2-C-methyl-D-erythritol 4-phosphate cytidylyltransferase [Pirellulaceae bacterium]